MTLKLNRLSENFVAEVMNFQIATDLTESTVKAIESAWLDNKVLLFRDQEVDEKTLVQFGRSFGELTSHVRADFRSAEYPEVFKISNIKENGAPVGALGNSEVSWHTDQIYQALPTYGTVIQAVIIPPVGGDTFFGDLATAYDRLPPRLHALVEGRKATHSVDKVNRLLGLKMTPEQLAKTPPVTHPLVRRHPFLGRKALYFSMNHTIKIEGMTEDETDKLLLELEAHASSPEFIYQHKWRTGDVLIWDNTSTMHRRGEFSQDSDRLMKRVDFQLPAELKTPF